MSAAVVRLPDGWIFATSDATPPPPTPIRDRWADAARRVDEAYAAVIEATRAMGAAVTDAESRAAVDAYDAAIRSEERAFRRYFMVAESERAAVRR